MARWSRAVAIMCFVYLLALLVFHHHLEPRNDRVVASDDYAIEDSNNNPPSPLVAPANASSRNLRHQLRDLEEGMTRLEEEIFNVKAKLAEEVLARKRLLEVAQEQQHKLEMQEQEQKQMQERLDRQQKNVNHPQDSAKVQGQGQPLPFLHSVVQNHQEAQLGQINRRPRMDMFHMPMANVRVPPTVKEVVEEEEDYNGTSLIKVGNGLAVYSAYHDDRLNETWVRIIVVLSGTKESRRLVCTFEMAGSGATYTAEAEQYEMCENHKKKYLGFVYSCKLPVKVKDAGSYKLHVARANKPEVKVPLGVQPVSPPGMRHGKVLQTGAPFFKYNFSVCVSPLFGSVSATRLVEFIELTHLLGVQHVHFYDFHVSSAVGRVLQYYEDKGWVSLLSWHLPTFMAQQKIWYQGQLVSNNDCLYRTMATSRYTAFHDIDEFIVPHRDGARTLDDIIPPFLPNDTCGFSFKSAFYDPGVATGFPDDLMTVALTARSEMISKVRTKVMVAPLRVFEVGIHHVSKQLLEPWLAHPFDPQVALLHHYRVCIRDFGMRCDNWVKDTIIKEKYMPELKDRMASVVKTLGL